MVMYLKVGSRGMGTSPLYIPLTGALNPSGLTHGPGDERDKVFNFSVYLLNKNILMYEFHKKFQVRWLVLDFSI